ncbi:MAG: aldo/keto reductase [Candidatus Heimdallarchaeota archaeon]|nr:MAG: aldo/keto reductase [Candidatus Heimdallarchaeota archaeon]
MFTAIQDLFRPSFNSYFEYRNTSVIAIPGAKNLVQLEENVGSLEFELTNDEINRIEKALKEFHPRLFL